MPPLEGEPGRTAGSDPARNAPGTAPIETSLDTMGEVRIQPGRDAVLVIRETLPIAWGIDMPRGAG